MAERLHNLGMRLPFFHSSLRARAQQRHAYHQLPFLEPPIDVAPTGLVVGPVSHASNPVYLDRLQINGLFCATKNEAAKIPVASR
jgi:hypothetical protein